MPTAYGPRRITYLPSAYVHTWRVLGDPGARYAEGYTIGVAPHVAPPERPWRTIRRGAHQALPRGECHRRSPVLFGTFWPRGAPWAYLALPRGVCRRRSGSHLAHFGRVARPGHTWRYPEGYAVGVAAAIWHIFFVFSVSHVFQIWQDINSHIIHRKFTGMKCKYT
jgi:hypothetical protein